MTYRKVILLSVHLTSFTESEQHVVLLYKFGCHAFMISQSVIVVPVVVVVVASATVIDVATVVDGSAVVYEAAVVDGSTVMVARTHPTSAV